jgi:hypothetical protein
MYRNQESHKIYMENKDSPDFDIYQFVSESDGLNHFHDNIIYDRMGIRIGYSVGSFESLTIYSYCGHEQVIDKTAPEVDTQNLDPRLKYEPAYHVFHMFVNYFDIAYIGDNAVDYISGLDTPDLYSFVKDNIDSIVGHLLHFVNMHIIIFEYNSTHRSNRYIERFSLCFTSRNTLIMRHYCRLYKIARRVSDTYMSDFNIYVPSSAEDESPQMVFTMTQVEFNLRGQPLHVKKYNILDNDKYKIIPVYECSTEIARILQNKYIAPLMHEMISCLDIDEPKIIDDLINAAAALHNDQCD